MATAKNDNSDDDDDAAMFSDESSGDETRCDDRKRVARESELVVKDFVYRRLISRRGFEDSDLELASLPDLDALDGFVDASDEFTTDPREREKYEKLGRTLATFGDEIEEKYKGAFRHMLANFNMEGSDCEFCFENFRQIAQRLFQNGIAWGRIVALLCFGYEMAKMYIKRGSGEIEKFLRKIVSWVVRFLVKEKIIDWIIKQGGWFVGVIERLGDPTQNSTELWLKRVGALAFLAATCYGCYRYIGHGS